MLKKITKKGIAIFMLVLILLSTFSNFANAVEINSAVIKNGGDCGYHLQFYDTKQHAWSYIITHYVYYEENGKQYPAYCLNSDLPGAETSGDYTVNINEVMDDIRLWRVAINGYPYQSPEAMGVANYQDAFVATKQAVYCILYNRDPNSYYQGGDSRGVAIKNAIVNLVNIGRNGNQTPMNTDVKANKIGSFFEDDNYYSQEYIVDSPVETSQYAIVSIAGMPNGSKITNMSNNEQSTFNGSEHFKIRIPKSQLNKDIDVTVVLRAKCKNYPVFYGRTTVAGTQNYMLTYDPFGDVSGQAKLNVKTNTGKIQINKTDDETRNPIEGVTFQLQKTDGTVIGNATTDKNGQASFSMLYQGKYILKEIETNEKYILNKATFDVDVEYNKTTTKNITNEHKRGNLKVYKVDKDNHKIPLGNVNFDLYSEEFKRVIGTYTTNVDGEFQVNDLRIGEYKLIEKNTGKWYNLADDKTVEVKWDTTEESTIENELKKGQVKVIKVDKDNNEIKLEGVTFEVLDENDNILEKIITNENGEALTTKYPIRDFNKIKIREEKTLDSYLITDEVKTIQLQENQITDIVFENKKIRGKVEITKVDLKDKNKKIEGVTFGVYDEKDNLIETLETSKEGTAISQYLYKGKYYLKELNTGSPYYLLNENTFEFEIVEDEKNIQLTIENEPTDITVDVEKEGTTEIKPGENVYYTFTNVANNSNVYLENFKWYDYIPTDYIRLEKMTTGTWNQDLTYKVFYKTNKSTDYILFRDNLSTKENYDLDFTTIKLAEDEYITETCFDFGKVEKGYKENTSPTMQCKSFDTLKENDTFTNHTKTAGVYYGVTAEANSKWTTITHIPQEKHEKTLPKTGK